VGRTSPEMVLSVVVLPAPLPPISATISPISTPIRNALQHLDVAVRYSEIIDLKHGGAACRDRPRSPADCAEPSEGAPSAIFLPKSSTVTRSLMPITSRTLCSTSNIVMPPPLSFANRIHQRHAFGHVHARGWFIEQQDIRLRRQRSCDLQQALLRVGQLRGSIVGPADEADDVQALRASHDRFRLQYACAAHSM